MQSGNTLDSGCSSDGHSDNNNRHDGQKLIEKPSSDAVMGDDNDVFVTASGTAVHELGASNAIAGGDTTDEEAEGVQACRRTDTGRVGAMMAMTRMMIKGRLSRRGSESWLTPL